MDSAHNVVSSLYALKTKLEYFLEKRWPDGKLKQSRSPSDAETVLLWSHEQTNRILAIMKRMQDLAREPAAAPEEKQRASVLESWKKCVDFFSLEDRLNDIKITEHIPNGFPNLACADRDLEEILYHLLKNAAQAIGKSKVPGKIILRAMVAYSSAEDLVGALQMADTGCGIRPEKLPLIFQPFYSTKPWSEGNGLGLWIVKNLVLRNKGRIQVQTFPGKGAAFTILFPIAEEIK